MQTVRVISGFLYYIARILGMLVLLIAVYASAVVILKLLNPELSLPISVTDSTFVIFLPFTHIPFLLGDFTAAYLVTNLCTVLFYAAFLWLLGGVFDAFKRPRLFTPLGVKKLSRFYRTNLIVPLLFLVLIPLFGSEVMDNVRVLLLHMIIGLFAFYMAAIFRQGLVLQEEQDLTF